MEGKSVRSIVVLLMIVVLMGMCLGETSTSFVTCYKGCMSQCVLPKLGIGKLECPVKCVKWCNIHGSPLNDLHTFCKMGCAVSKCINISTPQDPREDEVEGCVNSCSDKCMKPY